MTEKPSPANAVSWTEDPRYRISSREFLITLAYFGVYTVVTIGTAWLVGGGKSADQLGYILGFPAWFFWSTLVLGLVFCVVPYVLVKVFFTSMSLAPEPEDPDNSPETTQPK